MRKDARGIAHRIKQRIGFVEAISTAGIAR